MAGALKLQYILYTAFRLSPFIIVCFFSLSSILNQDLKGIIYLAGLLFSCFFAVIVGAHNTFSSIIDDNSQKDAICNAISLTESGRLSNLPLSMVVFSYTFFYLVDIIAKYNLASQNIPTLILFPLLIIGDYIWNNTYNCATIMQLIAAFGIGSVTGWIWSMIIRSTGVVQLQYFNGVSNSQSCSRPSRQMFKCKQSTA
jgi:hypothetical protein